MLRFDQLYVVSDLHFGGDAGFQIFGSRDAMVWLLDHLAQRDPAQQLALVINGDFVDFLAESDPRHFDPFGAVSKLERIALADPTFAPIFAALKRFVGTPNRHLIINLGNHDLELALPWVRKRLFELLTDAPPPASNASQRLHLILDGTGVFCTVGGRSVLCVHGNEVDRWNPADFEKIREIGRDVQLGRSHDAAWVPNAGTQMVIDVMNRVKRRFPFVDLLKPEKDAVVPVLAACDPSQLASLDRAVNLVRVFSNRAMAGVVKPRGMLGEVAAVEAPAPTTTGLLASAFARRDTSRAADDMMRGVENALRAGTDPLTLVEGRQAEQLGLFGAVRKWISDQPVEEVLREALEKLDNDRSFNLRDYDDTAKALDEEVAPAIDFVVAGHTHLERALPRRNGGGIYFNSGTWARLIRIPTDVRQTPAKFAALFNVLKDGNMATLDAQPGLVSKPNTVVAIRAQLGGAANAATGELLHVHPQGAAHALQPVAESRFARSG